MSKVGFEFIWLCITIEPEYSQILTLSISKERNIFVTEMCLSGLVKVHGKHPVSTDGGTWYLQDCRFLKLKYYIHPPHEKSMIERTIQYIKNRSESFMTTLPVEEKTSI